MKKVLVIIDMQNDFIDGPLGNDECKQAVPAVIDAVNNGGYTDVILTRDTHGDNYLNTQEGRKLPVVHCIKGTDGWQINSDIMKSGICVISNLSIAKATIPEVTVRLIENATACVTKDSKEAAVKTAGMIQVEIV